ncbi:hypothetical protein SRB17_84320 [Streptomyces sp. RB17]|nr:hypothetical protein [Streptomyces sp. RB17]
MSRGRPVVSGPRRPVKGAFGVARAMRCAHPGPAATALVLAGWRAVPPLWRPSAGQRGAARGIKSSNPEDCPSTGWGDSNIPTIRPVIARRGSQHGSGLGVHRWVVEAGLALLHWFRRLRTRWEIRDDLHQAFLTLGCSIMCRRRLKTSSCRRPQAVPARSQALWRQAA